MFSWRSILIGIADCIIIATLIAAALALLLKHQAIGAHAPAPLPRPKVVKPIERHELLGTWFFKWQSEEEESMLVLHQNDTITELWGGRWWVGEWSWDGKTLTINDGLREKGPRFRWTIKAKRSGNKIVGDHNFRR